MEFGVHPSQHSHNARYQIAKGQID
jgi:hypothetical protein